MKIIISTIFSRLLHKLKNYKNTITNHRLKHYLFIILSFLFIITASCQAMAKETHLSKSDISDIFVEANEFFRKANESASVNPEESKKLYRKSIMRFEKIIQDGKINNGKLYYNIGNAYFRIKDIGRAILNYRRAEQYMPNDLNLRQNLDYAKSKRIDKIKERQKTRVLKTLFFWHYDLSIKKKVTCFALFFAALWICATMRIFIKSSYLKYCIVIFSLLSFMFLSSLFIESIDLKRSNPGVIIDSEVIARKGDSKTYAPAFKNPLHAGTDFSVIEKRNNWYYIQLSDSRKCWIPVNSVDLVRTLHE